jgi:hypothetical protein
MLYSTQLLRQLRRTIGANIHCTRARRKIPLPKLARLSGVPEIKLDHFELGKNKMELDELLKIACALGVEAKNLLE